MTTPTPPLIATLLEDIAKLRDDLEHYRSRALESEFRLRLMDIEVREVRSELKKSLVEQVFGNCQPSPA